MAMAVRIAAVVGWPPSAMGGHQIEGGKATGMTVVESQRWSLGRRASVKSGRGGRGLQGGPGLMVVMARSSSGGRTNKKREEKQSRENMIPITPPPPMTSNSVGVRDEDEGVSGKVIPETVADDGEALVAGVGVSEPGAAELQNANDERESSTSSSVGLQNTNDERESSSGGSSSAGAESGDEIGKALSEFRREKFALASKDPATTTDFWKGVAEETRLIEWPVFSKVLGTTGVVVTMILGSSVVLLTVNAILAASSDYVFNDPAIRDFAKTYLNLAF